MTESQNNADEMHADEADEKQLKFEAAYEPIDRRCRHRYAEGSQG